MMKLFAIVVVIIAGIVIIGSAVGGGDSHKGSPAVYNRIKSLTDCAALQREFDTAEANHNRDLTRGSSLAEIDTDYMKAADSRMKAVGCYK